MHRTPNHRRLPFSAMALLGMWAGGWAAARERKLEGSLFALVALPALAGCGAPVELASVELELALDLHLAR